MATEVAGTKAETFFAQVNKTIKQILQTLEDAILTVPKLIFAVLGQFEILVMIGQIFLVGLVWMWLGRFLMHHIKILRFILNVLNDVAIAVSSIFGTFADGVEVAINAVGKAGNAVGGLANDVVGIFGGGHPIPKIPTIPLTKFPVLNFDNFIESLDGVTDATTLCSPFSSVIYEIFFPLRYALNDQVCPIVRYMYGTFVYTPFAWLLSLFYFDADPKEGNCEEIDAQYICFFLEFGNVLIYIITPLMLISFLWPWISTLVKSLLKLAEDIFILAFKFIDDLCKELFHREKQKNV